MTEHKNIYSALCAAQQEFGQVTKGSSNPAFKSKYASLSDVANVIIPTLSRHGTAVIHYMVGENLGAMRTEFVHAASETKISCDVPLLVDKSNMQGMKSATTYAKRIGLESLSGIAPEDDDGNAASQHRAPPTPAADPVTTLANRADALVARINAAEDGPALEKTWGLGAKLCAELDMKDPDKLAVITALYETRRDELTANPFTKDA